MPRQPLDQSPPRSACPAACALDVLGDRWTLLVLRDVLLFGKTRFGEFLEGGEGISSNTLAARLERLERHGLLEREVYQERPLRHRYVPTSRGRELLPVMRELIVWGAKHLPGTHQPTAEQLAQLDAAVAALRAEAD